MTDERIAENEASVSEESAAAAESSEETLRADETAPEAADETAPVESAAEVPAPEVEAEPSPAPKKRTKAPLPPLIQPEIPEEPTGPLEKDWYIVKVQSNRENSIRDAVLKRLKIASLDHYVDDVVVPTEKVTEIKDGKKRVVERKLYPGYIMMHLHLNNEIMSEIRETPGVGHFVGSGDKPEPMQAHEVAAMLGQREQAEVEQPRLKINLQKGDRVKITDGPFENFEGDVDEVIEDKGLVRVMVQVFNRSTPVDVEYWKVEGVS